MRRGDIVLAAVSGDYGKPRPFVIVQDSAISNVVDSVLACPLTSDVKNAAFRVILDAGADTGLQVRSEVMVEKLISFRQDRVRAVIGRISTREAVALDEALRVVLGLEG